MRGSAGLEHLERVLQIAAGRADERPDLRLQFPGGADGLAVDGVAQALLELGVVVDLRLQQQERGGRALLAGVAEGRVHHVLIARKLLLAPLARAEAKGRFRDRSEGV